MNPIDSEGVASEFVSLIFWPNEFCSCYRSHALYWMSDGSTTPNYQRWRTGWLADLLWEDYQ